MIASGTTVRTSIRPTARAAALTGAGVVAAGPKVRAGPAELGPAIGVPDEQPTAAVTVSAVTISRAAGRRAPVARRCRMALFVPRSRRGWSQRHVKSAR